MKKALFSVYDKKNIEKLAEFLLKKGFEIFASSGTKEYLKQKKIEVNSLSDLGSRVEGKAEGRIKTLDPLILEKILSPSGEVFDLVVCNLYPFSEKLAEGIEVPELYEYIDIGGVTLIRAACKNINRVDVLCDPEDYEWYIENYDKIGEKDKFFMAQKAMEYVTYYDAKIAEFFKNKSGKEPFYFTVSGKKIFELRYGENPSQKAFVFGKKFIEVLHGKKLSYNNILDVESAYLCVKEFEEPTCCIVKHTSPCGVASGETLKEAFERAFLSDPQSAFGGIVAFNKSLDSETAKAMEGQFFEIVIAESFDEEALSILKQRKNIRIIDSSQFEFFPFEIRTPFNFILYQERMKRVLSPEEWELKTTKRARDEELEDLYFALKVVKYVKSNAICIVKAKRTLGIGAGQSSRVSALEIAINKAKSFGLSTVGAVLASDAFFPFRDSIDIAKKEGISAIVVPSGSVRDHEIVEACEEQDIALYFIKERYFRH